MTLLKEVSVVKVMLLLHLYEKWKKHFECCGKRGKGREELGEEEMEERGEKEERR